MVFSIGHAGNGFIQTTQAIVQDGQEFDAISDSTAVNPQTWGSVDADTSPAQLPSGTLLSYAINEWDMNSSAQGVVFPFISHSLERSYTLNGTFERKLLTSNTYTDVYGNLNQAVVQTYGLDEPDAIPFASQTTVNSYTNDTSKWHLGRLVSSQVTHARAGTPDDITRKSGFQYHSTSGILTQEVIEPDQSAYTVITDYVLDAFGNRIQTTVTGNGMTSRTALVEYDPLGRFVIKTENALEHVTLDVSDWDAYGNPLQSRNIDGVYTTHVFDHMGRVFMSFTGRLTDESSWTGAWSKTINASGAGDFCPTGTAFRSTTTGGGTATQVQCFDPLGRSIRTAVEKLGGSYAYTDQYYDNSGRVERVSEPYYANESRYWNVTTYDEVGRVLIQTLTTNGGAVIVDSDNNRHEQLYTYDEDLGNNCGVATTNPGTVIITNGRGQERIEVKNPLGETEKVHDDLCGLITYGYDATGNLTLVTGADNETTTMSYDLGGRKIDMDDPDKGYWQYAYNALGEMTRQLDSKDQAIEFSYDVLGRVTDRREREGAGAGYTTVNRETSSYHISSPGKGQLASVTYRIGDSGTVEHQKTFIYDAFGRLDIVSTSIGAETFAQQTTYDQNSRVFQQFDASGDDHGLRYTYSNGYVSSIKEARDGVDGTIYQDILEMDARGHVTAMTLGNGVDVIAVYEQSSGRLENLSAYNASGVEIQEVDYLFDVLGNLKERHDLSASTNLRETFDYDSLNRLTAVDLSIDAGQVFNTMSLQYDASGNITYKSDVGHYLYNGAQPHAVSSADGVSYSYDANGNQTSGDGRTITYTVFDKPDSITKGSNEVTFAYGVGNSRYQREDFEGSVRQKTTLYLGATERIDRRLPNGTYERSFKRYLGGVAIATYYPTTGVQQLAYLLKDHIGSIHTVLNKNGQITTRMHFGAFGQRQDVDWQTPLTSFLYAPLNNITTRGFTGHEHVDAMGLIHMNGRIYDPKLGRFLQADPVVQAPKNSQSLNRYSYVLNNPLSYTDPSGYFFKELIGFVAAIVRVIYSWEDPSAWTALIAAGANLFAAVASQQKSLPVGAVPGAFTNGFITATSTKINRVRNGEVQITGDSGSGVRMATIGGTGSDETGWKFANGADTESYSYATNTGADWIGRVQTALDVIGLTPVVGIFADGANTVISIARGDWVGATLSAGAMIPIAGQGIAGAKIAGKTIAPAKRLSNQTVLGSYPDYIKLSDRLGARRFEMPMDVWNKLSPSQRWTANRKYLDRMISKGDEVILSNPVSSAQPGTTFLKEIQYLRSRGYRISDDGLRMIPGN